MALTQALVEVRKALDMFLNNEFEQARAILKPKCKDSMYHALGYAVLLYIQAVLTFDKDDIQEAIEAIKTSMEVNDRHRRRRGVMSTLMMRRTNYKAFTEIEAHAELNYAESLLMRGLISFVEDENLISFIKGGLRIKQCHSAYKECLCLLEEREWASISEHKVDFESGVRMGVGCFNLIISQLPTRILKLLEFMGFSGNKEVGLHHLKEACSEVTSLRSPMCSLMLVAYYSFHTYIFGIGDGDIAYCSHLMRPLTQRYPNGALVLFFNARMSEVNGDIDQAIQMFETSIKCQSEWQQFHHLCYWELMWCHSFKCSWVSACEYSKRLFEDSRWSRATYLYQQASYLTMTHCANTNTIHPAPPHHSHHSQHSHHGNKHHTASQHQHHPNTDTASSSSSRNNHNQSLLPHYSAKSTSNSLTSGSIGNNSHSSASTIDTSESTSHPSGSSFNTSESTSHPSGSSIHSSGITQQSTDYAKKIDALIRNVPSYKQRIAGKSIPIEKFIVKKADRYIEQGKLLMVPALEMMYLWNGFLIIGKNPQLVRTVHEILSRQWMQLDQKSAASTQSSAVDSYFWDDKCLLMLLLALCYKHEGRDNLCRQYLMDILDHESDIGHDKYLVPYSMLELALLYMKFQQYDTARQVLDKTKSYKGYSLESRLQFRVHAAHSSCSHHLTLLSPSPHYLMLLTQPHRTRRTQPYRTQPHRTHTQPHRTRTQPHCTRTRHTQPHCTRTQPHRTRTQPHRTLCSSPQQCLATRNARYNKRGGGRIFRCSLDAEWRAVI